MSAVVPPPRAAVRLLTVRQLPYTEAGEELNALLWSAGPGWRMISSAVLGGGIGARAWVLNAQVSHGYRRTDPARHLSELGRDAGVRGEGVGLMTAADVSRYAQAQDGGVEAVATSGISVRGWAAAPEAGAPLPAAPGTIRPTATATDPRPTAGPPPGTGSACSR